MGTLHLTKLLPRYSSLQQRCPAVGTYKGEPGGAKFYNIESTPNPDPILKLILNPRSPYLRNLDYMCHDPGALTTNQWHAVYSVQTVYVAFYIKSIETMLPMWLSYISLYIAARRKALCTDLHSQHSATSSSLSSLLHSSCLWLLVQVYLQCKCSLLPSTD